MLALQGPRALDVLTECTPAPLSTLKYYTLVDSEVCGEVATISRTGYTGEDGFEVIVSRAAGPTLWDSLLRAGAREELAVCGLGCRDTLRLEAAMPLYGHELDEATDPFTAGLDFGVKLNAGDFIGREALRERLQAPRTFVRVGLELDGRRIAREGCPVQHAGQPVGRVTSGTFSPTLQKSIAMAYVPPSLAGPGTPVDVEIRGQSVAASVVRLPFYQRASG
jgi:aminomethyltransferase